MWHQFGSWARFATGVWSPSANARRVLGREAHPLNTQHFGRFISQTWKSQMDDVFLCGKGQKYRDLNWSEVYDWLFVIWSICLTLRPFCWKWQRKHSCMALTMTMMWRAGEVHIARRKHFMCLSMGPGVGEVHRTYIGQSWSTTARFFVFARNPSLTLLSLSSLNGIRTGEIQRAYNGQRCTQLLVDNSSFFGHRSHHVFFSTVYLVIKAYLLVAEAK